MIKHLKEYRMADMIQIRRNNKTPLAECDISMEGKLCVITGATSGVGLEAARRLYRYGAQILMINRNEEKTRAVIEKYFSGERVSWIQADFSSLPSVRRAIAQIKELGKPVDVLINNAGVHMTRRRLTDEGREWVFTVNHLASFLLTRELIPYMASKGRIIQVNSQGHRFGGLNLKDLNWKRRPFIGLRAYGAAKTAQLLCTWEFADQLSGSGETINAMHPGEVRTNVGQNNGPLYRWFLGKFVWPTLKDAALSGQALHYLSASPDLAGISGKYFNLTHSEKPAPHALDRDWGKRVWQRSLELTAEPL